MMFYCLFYCFLQNGRARVDDVRFLVLSMRSTDFEGLPSFSLSWISNIIKNFVLHP